ncbi:hypothetical protein ONZ51_g6612 [Trametes cubensis]|uniref:Uncharacterized protein n=1 Tax=Trametes cubensis TaxID=1111947 RepID=A0AAD7XAY9_9APHY|nr:hypothetical protein ONZ51_g6612 [Trametes cubensis]
MGDTAWYRSSTSSDRLSSLDLSISGLSPRAHSRYPTVGHAAFPQFPVFIDYGPPPVPALSNTHASSSIYAPIFAEPGQSLFPPVVPGFESAPQGNLSPSEANARRHQHCWPQFCYWGDEKGCTKMSADPAADIPLYARPRSPPYRPKRLPGQKPWGHDAWPLAWWEIVPMPGRGTHLPNGWPRPTHVARITHPAYPGWVETQYLYHYDRSIEGLVAMINASGEAVLRSKGYTAPPVNPAGPCRNSMMVPHAKDTRPQDWQQ